MGNASVTVGDIRNENVNDWFSLNLTNGLNKTQIMSSLIKGTWKKEIQKRDIRKEKKGGKQAQRRAAAGLSRIFLHDAQNGFSLF